jgi:hypothetical protein
MNATLPLWVAIALPFIGYIAAAATEYLRGKQSLARDREARRDARMAAREDVREAFERDTLLALQEAMESLMRNSARIFHEYEMEFRRSGRWGIMLPEDIGGEVSSRLAREFQRLRVRLLNESLRNQANNWSLLAAKATIGALRDEIDEEARNRGHITWKQCETAYVNLTEATSERVRTLIISSVV